MKDLYIAIIANIKMFLGICNHNKCYKKAVAEIYLPQIDTKRCLCKSHLLKLHKILK